MQLILQTPGMSRCLFFSSPPKELKGTGWFPPALGARYHGLVDIGADWVHFFPLQILEFMDEYAGKYGPNSRKWACSPPLHSKVHSFLAPKGRYSCIFYAFSGTHALNLANGTLDVPCVVNIQNWACSPPPMFGSEFDSGVKRNTFAHIWCHYGPYGAYSGGCLDQRGRIA